MLCIRFLSRNEYFILLTFSLVILNEFLFESALVVVKLLLIMFYLCCISMLY